MKYEKPEMSVLYLTDEDVITESQLETGNPGTLPTIPFNPVS